jgi:uncharacterized protein (DUF433 family)
MKTATKPSNVKVVIAAKNKSKRRAYPPITINPERLGGTPTIYGTRLPVITLIDYLNDETAIKKFKEDFPGITDEQIQSVIETIRGALEEGWLAQKVDY